MCDTATEHVASECCLQTLLQSMSHQSAASKLTDVLCGLRDATHTFLCIAVVAEALLATQLGQQKHGHNPLLPLQYICDNYVSAVTYGICRSGHQQRCDSATIGSVIKSVCSTGLVPLLVCRFSELFCGDWV